MRSRWSGAAGFTLLELLVSTAIMVAILGVTMTSMNQAMRANETALAVTSMNTGLRTAMDMVVRDLLQAGAGLPTGHAVQIPSGANAGPVKLPGPPDTDFETAAGDTTMPAVRPGTGLGPAVNGAATDVISVLASDNTFSDVALTAVTNADVQVAPTVNFTTGPDRVLPGQLMMIEKGGVNTLVQVTGVNAGGRRIQFAPGDSLNLNQPGAAAGSLTALNATAPANNPASTSMSRVRLISYYIDATIPDRPRLMRRVNNGDPLEYNNALGTAVAMDVENIQFTYDLADGNINPSGVRFSQADFDGTGACAPNPCALNQIRKINVLMTTRSRKPSTATGAFFRNSLTSQVSLRGMAFVDEYLAP